MEITTFHDARARVTDELGVATDPDGGEGAVRYAVAITPGAQGNPIDDVVTLVSKSTGEVTQPVYSDVIDEMSMMVDVHDDK